MILTICPNPSIDCTAELQALNVGKVNRIENKILTYSGKALNVAIGVSRLGGDVTATGFMFERDEAQFLQSLSREGVKTDFVTTSGNVRINYKIIDNRSMMTEINDKGEPVPAEKQRDLIEKSVAYAQKASVTVMSGSLPAGVGDDYYAELISRLPKTTKVIVDCEGEKLKKAVACGVYMAKPNLEELQSLNNASYSTLAEMVEGAKTLIYGGAQNVLLSLGRKGAVLTDGKTHLYCKSATVAVNSTVGAGDSMIAAFALKSEQNAPRDEILRCAVAAGTASITTPGTNLFYKDKYDEIYKRIFVEEIKV